MFSMTNELKDVHRYIQLFLSVFTLVLTTEFGNSNTILIVITCLILAWGFLAVVWIIDEANEYG